MLPAAHRLTDGRQFRTVVRSGHRAGSRTMVVHVAVLPGPERTVPRIGLVVSKAVGNAVSRNRVQRRLRHLAREQLAALPGSCAFVIRALPASAAASTAELRADLTRCLGRAVRELRTQAGEARP